MTRLVRLEHTDAERAATLLGPLRSEQGRLIVTPPDGLIITDAAENIQRMLAALAEIGLRAARLRSCETAIVPAASPDASPPTPGWGTLAA